MDDADDAVRERPAWEQAMYDVVTQAFQQAGGDEERAGHLIVGIAIATGLIGPQTVLQWRVGRHNGRIIYRQSGAEPADTDAMIGAMDTPDMAALVVRAVNGGAHERPSRYQGRPAG